MDGRPIINNRRPESKERLVVKSPATLEPVGEARLASSADCEEALHSARLAFPSWRDLAIRERQRIFRRAGQILFDRSNDAARLLAIEKGSPLAEALSVEVLGSLEALDHYGRNLEKGIAPKRTTSHLPLFANKKSLFKFQPLGPTLIISPWNFPLLIPVFDILSALATGNTVILRPSTSTPFIALLVGEVFLEAGLPPGVLNIIPCRTAQAEELITHPGLMTIMFTGSVPVGKRIMELASRNLTNVVLELGGKDPMIVLKDADLERAVPGAVWAAFMNTGQSCASVERVYVAREVVGAFTEKAVAMTKRIKVGNPLDDDTEMGPLTTLGQLEFVEAHLREAKEKGASVLCGGERPKAGPGYFLAPAVLTGVDHTMKIMKEETFGPVLPIMAFSDPEEAIALANDCDYGLTASVWTRDKRAAARIADRLEAGSVTINDHMYSFSEPRAIWGGIKRTGMGRSHGLYGLLHLVNIKYIGADFAKNRGQLWWYPYGAEKTDVIRRALALLHQNGLMKKLRAALSLLPSWGMLRRATSMKSILRIVGRIFRKSDL
jgi:succinate-semialdehyde dehydrogenase/glutarate-semialdehyde dehydrogenase